MNRRLLLAALLLILGFAACAAAEAAPSAGSRAGEAPPSPAADAALEEAPAEAATESNAQSPAGQETGPGLASGTQNSAEPGPMPAAQNPAGKEPEGREEGGGQLLSCGYYDEAGFLQSVDGAEPYPAQGRLVAGVVPHHLLAGRMIAAFFARAAQEDPPYESVIFVGTSHYPTKNRLTTARGGWQTPFGTLENDREFTRQLIEDGQIAALADEEAMANDHAIAGLIPYAGYYLPDVPVSMVLIQNAAEGWRIDALAQAVAGYQGRRRALLICSTDFSHYLLPEEAVLRDRQTQEAIEGYDYAAVSRFTDGNVDSPPALTVFMKTAQPYGPICFFDHSSSERLLPVPLSDPLFAQGTTTYFVLGALAGE